MPSYFWYELAMVDWGRVKWVLAVAVIVVGLSAGVAQAAPGDLDTSYGLGTGASRPDLGGSEVGSAVVVQPDGKILLAGTTDVNGRDEFAAARLLSDGTPDNSFGQAVTRFLAGRHDELDHMDRALPGKPRPTRCGGFRNA